MLQTAYAKGSTVSSVISEPILPRPVKVPVLPLLHYTKRKHVNVRKKYINIVKNLIITYIMFAAGIGQRTYGIEVASTSKLQQLIIVTFCFIVTFCLVKKEYIYGIKDRNLPNNPKKVKMIVVFIV